MKKKTKAVLFGAAAAAALTPLWLMKPGKADESLRAPFLHLNIAHRGLHTKDKTVPENSLPAFRAAAEAGFGIELDVQLTRDGQVVVFHDNTLDRVCGVHAKLADKTLAELQALRLCGTEETIPLFTEVLAVVAGRSPIVCELKSGKRNRELCKKTRAILKAYKGDVCIESFDPFIVAWFRFHGRDYLRGQLSAAAEDLGSANPPVLNFMLSRCMFNFAARPQFIAYDVSKKRPLPVRLMRKAGALLVGWTSHDATDAQSNDAVIFEFYHPPVHY